MTGGILIKINFKHANFYFPELKTHFYIADKKKRRFGIGIIQNIVLPHAANSISNY
jgi:hypothetical protein